jgi:hypothetical protein
MNAAPITACLLHADYHAMDADCWDVTTGWYFDHQDEPTRQQRNAYQAAVERRILDGLRPTVPAVGEQPHA